MPIFDQLITSLRTTVINFKSLQAKQMELNDKKLENILTPEGSNLCQVLLTKVQRSIFNLHFSPSVEYVGIHILRHLKEELVGVIIKYTST